MIIIGFSDKTSKLLPRILCNKYKHVAPIIVHNNRAYTMYQFVHYKKIVKIKLKKRDIKILETHGWKFVYISEIHPSCDFYNKHYMTCVQMCKYIIGMHNMRIQTPYMLYKYLRKYNY